LTVVLKAVLVGERKRGKKKKKKPFHSPASLEKEKRGSMSLLGVPEGRKRGILGKRRSKPCPPRERKGEPSPGDVEKKKEKKRICPF